MRKPIIAALILGLMFSAVALAQAPQQAPGRQVAGAGAPPQRIKSAEILPDNRVTFRLSAPKASEVVVNIGDLVKKTYSLTKGENGIWTATIGPVEPGIYLYVFSVDGVSVIDMGNPIFEGGATINASVLEVRGSTPRFDEVQNVPHGSVTMHMYSSTVENMYRGLYVYVPPQYYTEPTRRYPVLYLWHGGGGAEREWTNTARAWTILDNLIAQQKAVPMIIAMPNNAPGTPANYASAPASAVASNPPGGTSPTNYAMLKRELETEIIPFVDKNYRTIPNRESRAIAGLSAGGGTSINVGLASLDTLAYVAEFSTGMFGGVGGYGVFDIDKIAPGFYKDPDATNKRLKLFYMSVGQDDPRLPFQKKQVEEFRSHKINVVFMDFPGAHEWNVWRSSLNDLAPRLFR
jgi:enterochelin esterase-like enzyme